MATTTASATTATSPSPISPTASPRFTLELEFVLCLANPYYLQHLAVNFPHLLNEFGSPPSSNPATTTSTSTTTSTNTAAIPATTNNGGTSISTPAKTDSDATKFANYISYLQSTWSRPEYAQYLTHPGATLRNLELLMDERFRRDVIRPDIIARLFEMNLADGVVGGG